MVGGAKGMDVEAVELLLRDGRCCEDDGVGSENTVLRIACVQVSLSCFFWDVDHVLFRALLLAMGGVGVFVVPGELSLCCGW